MSGKRAEITEPVANDMEEQAKAPAEFVRLYKQAFAKYQAQALWNKQMFAEPTPGDALVVAWALRIEGDMEARALAEQIEKSCGALI